MGIISLEVDKQEKSNLGGSMFRKNSRAVRKN